MSVARVMFGERSKLKKVDKYYGGVWRPEIVVKMH